MKSPKSLIPIAGFLFFLVLLLSFILYDRVDPDQPIYKEANLYVKTIFTLFTTAILVFIIIRVYSILLRRQADYSIWRLTLYGGLIGLIAESLYQSVRFVIHEIDLSELLTCLTGVSLFNLVIAFFVAFQMKTHRTQKLIIMIIAFILLFNLAQILLSRLC